MRSDDGYTLGECLVALFVIGLAIGGLSAGMTTIGRLQAGAARQAANARTVRAAHDRLARLLESEGPFRYAADGFQGAADGFRFDCGADRSGCAAWVTPSPGGVVLHVAERGAGASTLLLPGIRSAQFTYAGTRTIGPVWPVGSAQDQALHSVSLLGQTETGAAPIASARVWIDQAVTCDFDPILGDCRR